MFYIESVDSAEFKEPLYDYEHDHSNLDNEFEPFVSVGSKYSTFKDDLSTSSYLEQLASTASIKIDCKLDEMLTLAI